MVEAADATLSSNGKGAQLYVARDLLLDSLCPLEQDDPCRIEVVEGIGLLVVNRYDQRTFDVRPEEDS